MTIKDLSRLFRDDVPHLCRPIDGSAPVLVTPDVDAEDPDDDLSDDDRRRLALMRYDEGPLRV